MLGAVTVLLLPTCARLAAKRKFTAIAAPAFPALLTDNAFASVALSLSTEVPTVTADATTVTPVSINDVVFGRLTLKLNAAATPTDGIRKSALLLADPTVKPIPGIVVPGGGKSPSCFKTASSAEKLPNPAPFWLAVLCVNVFVVELD